MNLCNKRLAEFSLVFTPSPTNTCKNLKSLWSRKSSVHAFMTSEIATPTAVASVIPFFLDMGWSSLNHSIGSAPGEVMIDIALFWILDYLPLLKTGPPHGPPTASTSTRS
jgi:hypothetical protein